MNVRDGIVLQVRGLGILVRHPNDLSETGYEVRWSSDPEVSPQAPAHVFVGEKQIRRFLEVGVDPKHISSNLVKIIPVQIAGDQTSMTKDQCVAEGIDEENWSVVRSPISIIGKSNIGVHSHWAVWTGTRAEFDDAEPTRSALMLAKKLGITEGLTVFTHKDNHHLLRLAGQLKGFSMEMSPASRSSELILEAMSAAICTIDIDREHPERIKQYLKDIQAAFVARNEHREREAIAASAPDIQANSLPSSEADQKIGRGPSMH